MYLTRFKKRVWVITLTLLGILMLFDKSSAQVKFTLSGYVKDSSNGEALIGATVRVEGSQTGVVSNLYGFYSLNLPAGEHILVVDYLGYNSTRKVINLQDNETIDFQLQEESMLLDGGVTVTAERADRNVESLEMGVNRMGMPTLKKMPALLGEVDLVRSVQLLPGVSTVGEGSSGFNVRGGSVDQNLILLDESPVYNSSHLFGLFSVFNPDAVKDVKLIKGGIPAQYGGRLASILDVRMKEGNNKRFAMSGGIGTVSSRLTVEAPIIKDKASFIVSGRRSYADLFAKLSSDEQTRNNRLFFYDLSAKVNYTINENNKIYLSGYFGRDVFRFDDDFQVDWGNATGTLRWNHLFNKKLFSNFTFIYSNYNYSLGIPEGTQSFDWDSEIIAYNGKADFNYFLDPNNTLNFGASAIYYKMSPGKVKPLSDESIFNPLTLDGHDAQELAAYLDHEVQIGSRFSMQYGLRFSYYLLYGPGTYYDYVGEDGERKEATNPQEFGEGDVVADYYNFEPRISMRYQLDPASSIKLSYNRTTQYIHLISNTLSAAPTDVWAPSTRNIQPEWADQVALGYFRNFKDNSIEASAEVYYKTMSNQIDYIDGANTLLNEDLEGELLYGNGRSYGLELFVKKNTGKLNGWLSYTLSRSERKIDGINNNEWYSAKFDRTHNLSLVGIYDLNKRWSFSANFVYTSGVATTFPNARFEIDGGTITAPHNTDGSRNNYRVPAYHRLDLSATLQGKKNDQRRWQSSWVFSIYNAYARRNAFTVYFRQNEDNPQITEAVRLSVFGAMLPSITYNFNF